MFTIYYHFKLTLSSIIFHCINVHLTHIYMVWHNATIINLHIHIMMMRLSYHRQFVNSN